MGMIKRKKEQFVKYKDRKQLQRISAETVRLEEKRAREAEFAKAYGKKQIVERDVQKIEDYNKKARGLSNLERFGQGVAKAMKEVKELKSPKSEGSKGFNAFEMGSSSSRSPFSPAGTSPFVKKQIQPQKEAKKNIIMKIER